MTIQKVLYMPDLLSHALIGYGLGTLLSIRYDWLDAPWVTVLMIGAILPDVDKISILVSDATMEQWLGLPFSWAVIFLQAGNPAACAVDETHGVSVAHQNASRSEDGEDCDT